MNSWLPQKTTRNKAWKQRTVISIRPAGRPPIVMSKKTTGFAILGDEINETAGTSDTNKAINKSEARLRDPNLAKHRGTGTKRGATNAANEP
jgi:hypothetical protein